MVSSFLFICTMTTEFSVVVVVVAVVVDIVYFCSFFCFFVEFLVLLFDFFSNRMRLGLLSQTQSLRRHLRLALGPPKVVCFFGGGLPPP